MWNHFHENIVSFVGGHFHVKQYTQMLQNNLPMCVKTFLRETSCALFNNGPLVCHVYTLLICLVSFVCVRGNHLLGYEVWSVNCCFYGKHSYGKRAVLCSTTGCWCVMSTLCWLVWCHLFVYGEAICWTMRCEVSIVALTKNILKGNELCFVQQRPAGVSCLRIGQNQG